MWWGACKLGFSEGPSEAIHRFQTKVCGRQEVTSCTQKGKDTKGEIHCVGSLQKQQPAVAEPSECQPWATYSLRPPAYT